jgi:hypothetical protein
MMWDNLEQFIGLHEEVIITYLVDRYRVRVECDNNPAISLTIEAKNLQTCMTHLATWNSVTFRMLKEPFTIKFDDLD